MDAWLVFRLDNVSCVYEWRLHAERAMRMRNGKGMTDDQVSDTVDVALRSYCRWQTVLFMNQFVWYIPHSDVHLLMHYRFVISFPGFCQLTRRICQHCTKTDQREDTMHQYCRYSTCVRTHTFQFIALSNNDIVRDNHIYCFLVLFKYLEVDELIIYEPPYTVPQVTVGSNRMPLSASLTGWNA